ncbi:uncharacterized protein K452DRAFT_313757 [Aplosporella prunicola CBS 121167]|uniref:Uncharacterized protein n=1 Tax=Aplosporella prunicola CBS 121167 TaxID=1176127 RepID=A0A6A6AY89_9PEZI|nr:uncharacterized protein K452DRAFT_313757 [Aplosporella prunicola CBS 121167]KAF2135737.1 hypothetical protein K452DRAFT_313757 [Aplosporella prunicola CBS 121167]
MYSYAAKAASAIGSSTPRSTPGKGDSSCGGSKVVMHKRKNEKDEKAKQAKVSQSLTEEPSTTGAAAQTGLESENVPAHSSTIRDDVASNASHKIATEELTTHNPSDIDPTSSYSNIKKAMDDLSAKRTQDIATFVAHQEALRASGYTAEAVALDEVILRLRQDEKEWQDLMDRTIQGLQKRFANSSGPGASTEGGDASGGDNVTTEPAPENDVVDQSEHQSMTDPPSTTAQQDPPATDNDGVTTEPAPNDDVVDQSERQSLTNWAATTTEQGQPAAGDKKKKKKKTKKKANKGKAPAKDDNGCDLADVSEEEKATLKEVMGRLDEIEDEELRLSLAVVLHPYLYKDSTFRIKDTDEDYRPFSGLNPVDNGAYLAFNALKVGWMKKLRGEERFKDYLEDPHWPAIAESAAMCEVTYNNTIAQQMLKVFLAQWDNLSAYDAALSDLGEWVHQNENAIQEGDDDNDDLRAHLTGFSEQLCDRGRLDTFARAAILTLVEQPQAEELMTDDSRIALVRGFWSGWWPPLREELQLRLLRTLQEGFGETGRFIINTVLRGPYPPQDFEANVVSLGLMACRDARLEGEGEGEPPTPEKNTSFVRLAKKCFRDTYGKDAQAVPPEMLGKSAKGSNKVSTKDSGVVPGKVRAKGTFAFVLDWKEAKNKSKKSGGNE